MRRIRTGAVLDLDGFTGYRAVGTQRWCQRLGTCPLAVHAAWRTDPEAAAEVVLSASHFRTPEPLQTARRQAREARALSNSDYWREGRERW